MPDQPFDLRHFSDTIERKFSELIDKFSELQAGLHREMSEMREANGVIIERMNQYATMGRRLEETQKDLNELKTEDITQLKTTLAALKKHQEDFDVAEIMRKQEVQSTLLKVVTAVGSVIWTAVVVALVRMVMS